MSVKPSLAYAEGGRRDGPASLVATDGLETHFEAVPA
jgi:hypothetical protein